MTPPIHEQAATGFGRAGADYERGRPGYPEAAVTTLARELGIGPGRVVLDLAAGTGKLTRALSGSGAELIGVEPVTGMREQLVKAVPGARALDGTAERIPLPDGAVDAVLVAQAFHWFDAVAAAAEIHRVLRPGGGLGVIWNSWDESVPWVKQTQALVHEHVNNAPQQRTSPWAKRLAETRLFTALEQRTFPNVVHGDLDTLLARVASVSYIAALDEPARQRVLDAVREVVVTDPVTRDRCELAMPYTTHVTWCRPTHNLRS
ncbi:MAG: class I SAM-dependent methyltransferase [Solirubrobacteraceae bacterium]